MIHRNADQFDDAGRKLPATDVRQFSHVLKFKVSPSHFPTLWPALENAERVKSTHLPKQEICGQKVGRSRFDMHLWSVHYGLNSGYIH